MAQQNIFNVPSVEVTLPRKIFIQQQFNINAVVNSNTTFDYGLKGNMEIGLNFFNIAYQTKSKQWLANPGKDTLYNSAASPLLLVNFLKQWELSKSFKIGAGLQSGTNIPLYDKIHYAGFYYLSSSSSLLKDHLKIDAGLFYGNRFYLGKEHMPGIMLGYELSILHNQIHLTGDWLSGRHDLGIGVIGLVIYPDKALPISLGYQLPNSKNAQQAFVVEFTYIQSHRKKR